MSNPFTYLVNRISLVELWEAFSSVALRLRTRVGAEAGKTATDTGKVSFSEIIKAASREYEVDENLIMAMIRQESSFNPTAVSASGAQGLMQLMPATAQSLGVTDAFDPEENIMAGTRYLKQKLQEFDGNLALALAAYNAGSSSVLKYGGIPPYKETQAYVDKVIKSIDYRA